MLSTKLIKLIKMEQIPMTYSLHYVELRELK